MTIYNPQILNGISILKNKLQALNIDSLNIGVYNLKYLKTHVQHLYYTIYLNGCVLQEAIDHASSSSLSFCDYGGGTGLLGFLAKESFACTLIYVDLYPDACRDVRQIAIALNIEFDQVVEGDIRTLINSEIKPPLFMISRDVIEHIYDLKEFYADCYLWNPDMIHVHNTSANIYNLFRKKYFKRIHRLNEHLGVFGIDLKATETTMAYLEIRKEMIRHDFPDFDHQQINLLAAATRGMLKAEILKTAQSYRISGEIEKNNLHPTNTCDPYTGNWAERLLNFPQYSEMAKPNYSLIFSGTYFNTVSNGFLKRNISRILNLIISISGFSGRFIWPTFTICSVPKKSS